MKKHIYFFCFVSKFIIAALLLTATWQQVFATNYYVSSTGNDVNKGTSVQSSWQSIERLNKQKLLPGDTVFFKCGNSFYGTLQCSYSGEINRPVVYTSYGKGNKPIITGAVAVTKWLAYNKKIIVAKINKPVFALFANNQFQFIARWPNRGFAAMQQGVGSPVTFIDTSLNQEAGFWNNATIRFRTWDWEIRTSTVKDFADYKVTIADSSTNNLSKGWGYYFDNKFVLLDTAGEWMYNLDSSSLFLYGKQNKKYEAVTLLTGINILQGIHHITIAGLQIEKFFENGIYAAGNNQYISITGNSIQQIDKTGIHINAITKQCSIKNNSLTEINGRGIYALEPEYLTIEKNNVTKIGFIPGYGFSGVNNMIGIAVVNKEVEKNETSHIALHNSIRYNFVDSTGYVGIRMDGANSIMEYNIISNVMEKLSDGSAIYTWALSKNYSFSNVIRHNIIRNAKGSNYGSPNEEAAANGIYIDNRCYNITVANNTVYDISSSGIHINSDAYNNTVCGNTIYNCNTGLSVAEWAAPKATYGNVFSNNKIFILSANQQAVYLINFLLPGTTGMASFDSNQYCHLRSDTIMKDVYNIKDAAGSTQRITTGYNFEDWCKKFGYEASGKSWSVIAAMPQLRNTKLLINNGGSKLTIKPTSKKYYTLDGKKLTSINLLPFQTRVVLTQ